MVLLVDDEPDILSSVKMLIEAGVAGVDVLTASSGREALELLTRARADLVISDFRMPGMDGVELLTQVARLHPSLPTVLFTAYSDEALAKRARSEAGVAAVIAKGGEPSLLLDRIKDLLRAEPLPKRAQL